MATWEVFKYQSSEPDQIISLSDKLIYALVKDIDRQTDRHILSGDLKLFLCPIGVSPRYCSVSKELQVLIT